MFQGSGFSFGGAPATTSGFSFGGAPASTQPATNTGFSFGGAPATTQQANTGFSFGGAPATTQQANTGFSFGGTQPATTTTQANPTATGFSFGGTQPATTTTSSFNSSPFSLSTSTPFSTNTNQSGQSTGLFGQTSSTQQSTFGGFGLGSQASTSPFPFQTQTQTQAGQQQLFQFQQQQQQRGADPLIEQIAAIENAYNPDSEYYRFRFFFYNVESNPERIRQVMKPDRVPQPIWDKVQQDNPDPEHLIPEQVKGFKGLEDRIKKQEQFLKRQKGVLEVIKAQLAALHQNRMIEIAHAKGKQAQLAHQLLTIMKMLEVLRNRGYASTAEEESLRNKLEQISKQLDKPTLFKGKIDELKASVAVLSSASSSSSSPASSTAVVPANGVNGAATGGGFMDLVNGDTVVIADEASLENMLKVLEQQQQAIKQLTTVLNQDMRSMDIMSRGYKEKRVFDN